MKRKFQGIFVVAAMFLLAGLTVFQLPGCSGGGSGSASTGTLQVSLTDAQSDAFENVFISIKEIRVVPAGKEDAADDDPGLPVVATFATPHRVDVLTLRFQQDILGTVTLPAGNYNQVRLILEANPSAQGLDPVNYVALKADPTTKIPLKTPSGQESGLKVLGKFTVEPGVINAILIDFDPNTAIVIRGNGDYNLKPTGIRIVQTDGPLTDFGSLSGLIVSTFKDFSSATVSVIPQGSSNAVASGMVFSNFSSNRWEGPFAAFVPSGDYRVHVRANGFANYSTQVQPVLAGQDTLLDSLTLVPLP